MVQLLVDPASAPPHQQPGDDGYVGGGCGGRPDTDDSGIGGGGIMSRDEHSQRMRHLRTKRGVVRPPRRGWTLSDFQADASHQYHQHHHYFYPHYMKQIRQACIPENAALSVSRPDSPAPSVMSSTSSTSTASSSSSIMGPLVSRPKMPSPRRSQSVTDKEPELIPAALVPSNMTLLDLPSELHYNIFDILDPIDGACLGLAHSRLYAIHQRKNGKVPLSSRYYGPNDMEWAWRAAAVSSSAAASNHNQTPSSGSGSGTTTPPLEKLRVKGQVYCRKCGISRCELHRHLRDWMGDDYEYCEIRKVFGPPAAEDAKSYCFLSSPKNPHRCGRHGAKKT